MIVVITIVGVGVRVIVRDVVVKKMSTMIRIQTVIRSKKIMMKKTKTRILILYVIDIV